MTGKGQVDIPKRVHQALGIAPDSKAEFDLGKGGARLRLVNKRMPSRVEEGPAILNYSGPRITIAQMHGGVAIRNAASSARR